MRGRFGASLRSISWVCGNKCLGKAARVEAAEADYGRERSGGRRSSNDNSMAPPIAKHGLNAAAGWRRRAKDDTLLGWVLDDGVRLLGVGEGIELAAKKGGSNAVEKYMYRREEYIQGQ